MKCGGIAIENIEINFVVDAVYPASFTVLPEDPVAFDARRILPEVMGDPQRVVVKLSVEVLPVKVDIGINNGSYAIILLCRFKKAAYLPPQAVSRYPQGLFNVQYRGQITLFQVDHVYKILRLQFTTSAGQKKMISPATDACPP